MGKESKAAWEARVVRAFKEGAESVSPKPPKRTTLVWLRSVGAGSICLGGLGLMQTFFWPSIAALYIGVILLTLDLLFVEKFDTARWVKSVIFCAILVLAGIFAKAVVFRRAPLGAVYRTRGDVLEVYLTNESDDDYENLDLKIKPDFPKDFVSSPEQVTHIPGISFVDAMPGVMTEAGESAMFSIDNSVPDAEATDAINNFLRVRGERIPARTTVRLRMKLVRQAGKGREPVTTGVQKVLVQASLKGRFRTFRISEEAGTVPAVNY